MVLIYSKTTKFEFRYLGSKTSITYVPMVDSVVVVCVFSLGIDNTSVVMVRFGSKCRQIHEPKKKRTKQKYIRGMKLEHSLSTKEEKEF